MRKHYGLDKLTDYRTEDITEPAPVVNPAYRALGDGKVRSYVGKLNRLQALFGTLHFEGNLDDKNYAAFEQKKADLKQEIEQAEAIIKTLNSRGACKTH